MGDLEEGRRVLNAEAQAILDCAEKLDESFSKAVELIVGCHGKVICVGMGKSGQVGRKIASTLSSTGTPALFLHPVESSHGDLGVISQQDVILAISKGGESEELAPLLTFIKRRDLPLIAMTENSESTLGKAGTVVLNIPATEEACPLGLAPTTSSTATLAMGDALAMAALKKRGFSEKEFAEFHPGGKIGRRLLTRVRDLMHTGEALPLVSSSTPVQEVLSLMTKKEVRGVAGIVDDEKSVKGVITDGDIRRHLRANELDLSAPAKTIMTLNPKTIDKEELAEKALFVMEQFQIQMLFVLDSSSAYPLAPVGLIHIQDLIRSKIK